MSRRSLIITGAALIVLLAALILNLLPRQNGAYSAAITLSEGEALHTELRLYAGTAHLLITDEAGAVIEDELFSGSYRHAFTAYRPGVYTVKLDFDNALGRAQLFLTDENGTRLENSPLLEKEETP